MRFHAQSSDAPAHWMRKDGMEKDDPPTAICARAVPALASAASISPDRIAMARMVIPGMPIAP